MRWLADLLRGGSDELGWDDLIRRAVRAIAGLARYADRGRVAFPPDVIVRIEVGDGSLGTVRAFVEKPEFDAEVGAALANECDCSADDLPAREYVVRAASATSVVAEEGPPRSFILSVEGGDLGGSSIILPRGNLELRFGRGRWHGPDRTLRNDVVVCEATDFVSRKAGRLLQSGRSLEVEALDQGDALSVRRPGGSTIRPARTARGRVALRDGDAIELSDGKNRTILLVVRSSTQSEGEGRDGADS